MRLLSLELKDFKSYRHLYLDLEDPDGSDGQSVIAIVGENGAGKTSILEAIGAALFDYVEGKHSHLIREGEKGCEIKVTIAVRDDASPEDERKYTVVRRMGANSCWQVIDTETGILETEKVEETRKWISQKLGLDEHWGVELPSLFRDSVGVPQGTITAPFLERPQERKEKFDKLLRLKEYEDSSERLRDIEKEFEKRIDALASDIDRLSEDVDQLPQLLNEYSSTLSDLGSLYSERARLEEDRRRIVEEIDRLEELKEKLKAARDKLDDVNRHWQRVNETVRTAQERVERAEKAHRIVGDTRSAYEEYLQLQPRLQVLHELFQQFTHLDALRHQYEQNIVRIVDEIAQLSAKLQELQELTKQIPALEELERREVELREQIQRLDQDKVRLEHTEKQIASLEIQLKDTQQRIDELRRDRDEVLRHRELASSFDALLDREQNLRAALAAARRAADELTDIQTKLQTHQAKVNRKRSLVDQLEESARHIPGLQTRLDEAQRAEERVQELRREEVQLRTVLNETMAALRQSKGGNCPFLKEPCRNMAEGQDLESYFQVQAESIQRQLKPVADQIAELAPTAEELPLLREALANAQSAANRLNDERGELFLLEEEMKQLEAQVERAQHEAGKAAYLETQLQDVARDLARAREARDKLAGLGQLEERIEDLEQSKSSLLADLDECRLTAESLQRNLATRPLIEQKLAGLGDPPPSERLKEASFAQRNATEIAAQLEQRMQEKASLEMEKQSIEERVRGLPPDIATEKSKIEQRLRDVEKPYQLYLTNVQLAEDLPAAELAYQRVREELNELTDQRESLKLTIDELQLQVDERMLEELKERKARLEREAEDLQTQIGRLEERRLTIEERRRELERKQQLKDTKLKERDKLTEILSYVGQLRADVRRVGDLVGKQIVQDISRSATTLFHDIMGGIAGELEWSHEDYSLQLRIGSKQRLFAQLSGGEQMAAGLAIRLALLQHLSNVRFAFFDEPTQNLDHIRREALAEQIGNIQNIRGFDQIFVISHDDTFSARTDRIIRVTKREGESRAVPE